MASTYGSKVTGKLTGNLTGNLASNLTLLSNLWTLLKPGRAVRRLAFVLDAWRRRRAGGVDYVMINLPPSMPVFPEPRNIIQRRLMGEPPLSLWDLDQIFTRVAHDPKVKGVILNTRGLALSFADLQSLRGLVARLAHQGKHVITFAHTYDLRTYYVASAGSEIALLPGGELQAVGLRAELTFLREALDALGIEMDVIAISAYKNAMDIFTRAEISPESREQFNWLLDSLYAQVVTGIAEGRQTTPDAVREMIDGGPHSDEEAHAAGYVDVLCSEEGLIAHLGTDQIMVWEEASRRVRRRWEPSRKGVVAVLPLEGMIVEGETRRPPVDIPLPFVGADRMGSRSVVQQIRNLIKDDQVKAVVLHINSPGGSSTASEGIAAALDALAAKVPVVACMSDVAASGGYYIASPAHWIVAQPGTITGSIGVVMAKVVNRGLLDKLHVHPFVLQRGANADYFSSQTRFNAAQRAKIQQLIERIYGQFVGRVAESREMTPEAVDAVGKGRVWTGQQALDHHLVDQLGDWRDALDKARELAGLSPDAPAVIVREKGKPLAPQVVERANPAAALQYVQGSVNGVFCGGAQMMLPVTWIVK